MVLVESVEEGSKLGRATGARGWPAAGECESGFCPGMARGGAIGPTGDWWI